MRQIGESHKAEIEGVLAELKTLAETMPTEEFEPENKKLDLEPYMHVADRLSNTVMASKDQFTGVVKRLEDPTYFDMYTFAHELMLSDRFSAEPAEPTFEAELKALINVRYVIVYYPVDYRDATITENEYLIDPLKLIVAMYDRGAKKWLFSKTFTVAPPDKIEFSYKPGQKESHAEFKVKEHFIETVEPQIDQYIESLFGGTIEFDHDAYRRDGTRRI